MKKIIAAIGFIIILVNGAFKQDEKGNDITYILPDTVEQKANVHVNEMTEWKGKTIKFYASLSTIYSSTDTLILSIYSYPSNMDKSDKLYRLVSQSNRFVKIGSLKVPIVFYEDFRYSNIINTKNTDGSIGRMVHLKKAYSITFTGKSYEKGQIILAGWAGG